MVKCVPDTFLSVFHCEVLFALLEEYYQLVMDIGELGLTRVLITGEDYKTCSKRYDAGPAAIIQQSGFHWSLQAAEAHHLFLQKLTSKDP